MLGPVKFMIDNYPKVFKTVCSLETNFIHGDDSMSVSVIKGWGVQLLPPEIIFFEN